jgi:hypothetical protein
MWKANGRQMPSDGKSSHCLWQGELKSVCRLYYWQGTPFIYFYWRYTQWLLHYLVTCVVRKKALQKEIKWNTYSILKMSFYFLINVTLFLYVLKVNDAGLMVRSVVIISQLSAKHKLDSIKLNIARNLFQ